MNKNVFLFLGLFVILFFAEANAASAEPTFTQAVYGITNTTASFSSNASQNANMTIRYGTTLNLGSLANNATNTTNLTLTITGLSPYTLYYYNVTRINNTGGTNTTGPFNFTTLATPADYCWAHASGTTYIILGTTAILLAVFVLTLFMEAFTIPALIGAIVAATFVISLLPGLC